METRASFIATMQETQHLSPEKGQSPANGNREQFDSGELSFTPMGCLHCYSPLTDHQWRWGQPCWQGSVGNGCTAWRPFLSLTDWTVSRGWWVGKFELFFFWISFTVHSSYSKFKQKAMESLSQDIILCSCSFPTLFYFVEVLWLKRGNEHSEITAFLLCFDHHPHFLHNLFECFRWEGFTNIRPASRGLVACCPCAQWYDWMLCNALEWASKGEDSLP